MYCGAAFAGVQGASPLFCFSFAGVFFFKQKENAETLYKIKYFVKVGSEGSERKLRHHIVPLTRQRCVESPYPTKSPFILHNSQHLSQFTFRRRTAKTLR